MVPDDPAQPGFYETRALGTGVQLLVTRAGDLDAAIAALHRELTRVDGLASRFRPDSELNLLNHAGPGPKPASADLLDLVERALWAAEVTDGAVDPTIGPALIRLGYDRDFAQVPAVRAASLPAMAPAHGWRQLMVDREGETISLPPDAVLDLGATAKALTADRAAAAIAAAGDSGVIVSLGGDVAVAGPAPEEGFVIGLAEVWDAPADHVTTTIAVDAGGVATSGTAARHWWLGPHHVHHVIDPRTGLPALSYWHTVTVAAASCLHANVAATAAVVKGPAALTWLEEQDLAARLVGEDGEVITTAAWPADPVPAGSRGDG